MAILNALIIRNWKRQPNDLAPTAHLGAVSDVTQRHRRNREGNGLAVPLTVQQRDVLEALRGRENERYPLGQWYLGAIYALSNPHNPDRYSQAAQSLRELLEKLPRVVLDTPMQVGNYPFLEAQQALRSQLSEAAERYEGEWSGKTIDPELSKTLSEMQEYLVQRQKPTRRDSVNRAVANLDPLFDQLEGNVRTRKLSELAHIWAELENHAHHGSTNPEAFQSFVDSLDRVILDVLAPIRAEDQLEILAILQEPHKSPESVTRIFDLIEKNGANFAFFFAHATDTSWLSALKERGYFSNPPAPEQLGSSLTILPNWWPMRYLVRVASLAPKEVIEIVQHLPETISPRIYDDILEIALNLPTDQSVQLQPQLVRFARISPRPLSHRFPEVLIHWTKNDQIGPALELASPIVYFDPDPEKGEKWRLRQTEEANWTNDLQPRPKLEQRDYLKIVSDVLRPLSDATPWQSALLLASALTGFIHERIHEEEKQRRGEEDYEDYSEISWPRLKARAGEHLRESNSLIFSTIYACEQVYEKMPECVEALDQHLRSRRWKVFRRLRHHLYGQYISDQTKEWIRQEILNYPGYATRIYSREFQQMIKNATGKFGLELLEQDELAIIFDEILNGPSKESLRRTDKEEDIDELLNYWRPHFHKWQLQPFQSVLFGKYLEYLRELEHDADSPLLDRYSDDLSEVKATWATRRSPSLPSDLAALSDEDILSYVNQWEDEQRYPEERSVEVTIEALAETFEITFGDSVIPKKERLEFWLEHKDKIQRPIYVRAMLNAMRSRIKNRDFDNLDVWLETAEWVLSKADRKREPTRGPEDRFRENPYWGECRRTVVNLLGDLVSLYGEDNGRDLSKWSEQLLSVFGALCTQYDGELDEQDRVRPGVRDWMSEAINHTRSLALEYLIRFGCLSCQHFPEFDVAPIKGILEARFAPDTELPLTLPERAVLGRYYSNLLSLDDTWASERKPEIFPQNDQQGWEVALGSFLEFNSTHQLFLEFLRDDFEIALGHPTFHEEHHPPFIPVLNLLGQHLWAYYESGLTPLWGQESLIGRFYNATEGRRERWADLFDHVGWCLYHSGPHLDEAVRNRVIEFFQWRLGFGDASELGRIGLWLEAECLDQEWRLHAFSQVLDVCRSVGAPSGIDWEKIAEMVPEHTSKVVECFLKFSEGVQSKPLYVQRNAAKRIIDAGLNGNETEAQNNAKRARNNLLNSGSLDMLALQDLGRQPTDVG